MHSGQLSGVTVHNQVAIKQEPLVRDIRYTFPRLIDGWQSFPGGFDQSSETQHQSSRKTRLALGIIVRTLSLRKAGPQIIDLDRTN